MGLATALITGASSGIGAELARLCAAGGYAVILTARDTVRLEALAAALSRVHGIPARALAADLADPAAPARIYEAARGDDIEILINNAGFGLRGAFAVTDWEAEARMIQLNITALVHLSKLFLPDMLRRRSGRILNVASTAAFVPGPYMAVYYASKAFVDSFSHALANEVNGSGVTVTSLCPGPTRTNFGDVAGMAGTKLFRGPMMSAEDVAREGYRAMMAGEAGHIAGLRNRLTILGTRLAPRTTLAAIARGLNR